jgi:opacity protein-like surface antigen
MLIFDKKALSSVASYENFSFQVGLGVQVRLTRTLDLRAGYSDIHFSNAFVVPSNPGLDVMSCNAGLSYHLGK